MKAYIAGALLLALGVAFPRGVAAQGNADSQPNWPGIARGLVREGDVAVFPFGRSQPTVVCWIRGGEWIRYSTPEEGGAEYIAVCLPAFSPETVHRDA